MIAKVLGKIGLPIIIRFMSTALAKLDNPAAKNAGEALYEVDSEIQNRRISAGQLAEANRHVEKAAEIEAEFDAKTLAAIHETIRRELTAEDRFVRFWRPAFGYSVALAWFLNMLTICYVVLFDEQNAAAIISALVETTSLWSVALGVLGIQVVKSSQEKLGSRKENLLSKALNKVI